MPDPFDRADVVPEGYRSLDARMAVAEAWIQSGRERQKLFEETVLSDLKDIKKNMSEMNVGATRSATQLSSGRRMADHLYTTAVSVVVVVVAFVLQHITFGAK